jgi:hypothetical protein
LCVYDIAISEKAIGTNSRGGKSQSQFAWTFNSFEKFPQTKPQHWRVSLGINALNNPPMLGFCNPFPAPCARRTVLVTKEMAIERALVLVCRAFIPIMALLNSQLI